MALAKQRNANPRKLAAHILAALDVSDLCDPPEVAGAGFINFRLRPSTLMAALVDALRSPRPFVRVAPQPRTYVVDFSSPNVAKPMHVGHIRSTILGDAITRLLRQLGHQVITDNHIGDWGTQFGMLLVGWKTLLQREQLAVDPMGEMERIYREINSRCDPDKAGFDPAIREQARNELVRLQRGDAENLGIWREMLQLSQRQFESIYSRLGVHFDHTLGESFYNPRLPGVVEALVARGIARESEGATVVFGDGTLPPKDDPFQIFRDGEWHPNPQLIRKADGGFNYSTTDLATLAYRVETWNPDEIIYVTDGRQQLHFRQLFATFRRWRPEARVRLEHVWFGAILGEDGRPLKTRSGENIKLAELLDEAESRAARIVAEKNPDLGEEERRAIARVVGIGAVKYADLLPNRQSDYVFSWDKMLSFTGNTAPYLQYSYARIRSIFRKAGADGPGIETTMRASDLEFTEPNETALARHLLNYGLVVEGAAAEGRPNYLCVYLFELASHFSRFFETCPVLKAEGKTRVTRLVLIELTARVLKNGLAVLGIQTMERM